MNNLNKSYILFLLITILQDNSYAQENMVPNRGFEDKNCCPKESNQNTKHIDCLEEWRPVKKTPGGSTGNKHRAGTSDYYNTCGSFNGYNIVPYEGSGMVGSIIETKDRNYREYFSAELKEMFKKDLIYYGSFWTHAFYGRLGNDFAGFTNNKIGIVFSNRRLRGDYDETVIDNDPEVLAHPNRHIYVSDGWTKVEGCFLPSFTGNKQWITIGSFDANIDRRDASGTGGLVSGTMSYYMFDNITVGDLCLNKTCSKGVGEIALSASNTHSASSPLSFWNIENGNYMKVWIGNRWGNRVYEEIFFDCNGELGDFKWDGRRRNGNLYDPPRTTAPTGLVYVVEIANCSQKITKVGNFTFFSNPPLGSVQVYDRSRTRNSLIPRPCCQEDLILKNEYLVGSNMTYHVSGNISVFENVRVDPGSNLNLFASNIVLNPTNVDYDGSYSSYNFSSDFPCSTHKTVEELNLSDKIEFESTELEEFYFKYFNEIESGLNDEVEEEESVFQQIYPNPVDNNSLTIYFNITSDETTCTISVVNMQGFELNNLYKNPLLNKGEYKF